MKLNINDHVYYSLYGICLVSDIQELKLDNEVKSYYVLTPLNTKQTIFVPTNNGQALSKVKKVLSIEEIDVIIKESKNIQIDWSKNSKERNQYFQSLLKVDDLKTTIALIRTIDEHKNNNDKVSPNDLIILSNAQNLLKSSLSFSLNITKEEVEDYVTSKL